MKKIPMLEKFAAQSLVEYDGELIFSKERFAELLVKECVVTVLLAHDTEPLDDWDRGYNSGVYASADTIREKFGIE